VFEVTTPLTHSRFIVESDALLEGPPDVSFRGLARKILFSERVFRMMSGEYTRSVPNLYATYTPWYVSPFAEHYDRIRDRTEVSPDRCYFLQKFAAHCCNLSGDFVECGVYRGGTAYLIAETMKLKGGGDTLHLFDTFEGMPSIAAADPSAHRPGDFGRTSLSEVRAFLSAFDFVRYYPGRIPETLGPLNSFRFAFVHVDVDLYDSAKSSCEFFYDRLVNHGMMVFDDYGFQDYSGSAKRAVDEFLQDKLEEPIVLPTGQCLMIKSAL